VTPLAIEGFAGVTAIDCNVAAVTVSKVEPLMDDDFAVIVEVPTPAALARPAALIVAVVVVPELHVTVLVRFCVVPSLNVPVAVNCCVAPLAIDGFAGVTEIDCSVAAVTVSKVEPLIDDDVAVMVEVPTPAPVARPAALIVAVVVVPEDQVTVLVRFCVVPSLNVPVAVNCCVAPLAIDGFAGVTAIDCSVAAVTVSKVEPLIDDDVAVMVEVPTPAPVARPDALMVAVTVVPDDHVTLDVRFCVEPSLNVPVAVNCCVAPLAIDGFAGVTAIDFKVGATADVTMKLERISTPQVTEELFTTLLPMKMAWPPGLARSPATRWSVSWVELTKVSERGLLFQFRKVEVVKPVPLMVKSIALAVAEAVAGLKLVMASGAAMVLKLAVGTN